MRKSIRCAVADFGASSGRVFIGVFDGKTITLEECHRFPNKIVYANGRRYWDILYLYGELITGLKKGAGAGQLDSIGIDSWACDCGFLDGKDRLIANPISYLDGKRNEAADSLFSIMPEERLFILTGAETFPVMTLIHLYQLQQEEELEYRNGELFLMLPDLFSFFLTGEKVSEYTNLTSTLCMGLEKKEWCEDIIKTFHLNRSVFPEYIGPGEKVGLISEKRTGEPMLDEIPVITPASWDTCSMVSGLPIQKGMQNEGSGWLYVSLGTWGVVGVETKTPVVMVGAFKAGFANAALDKKRNTFFSEFNGLFTLEQCRKTWEQEERRSISWEETVREAESSPEFAGFIDLDNGSLFKPIADMPELIREECGKGGFPIPWSRGETVRCIYESLVFTIVKRIESLRELVTTQFESLYITGGGSRNHLLCGWIAACTGLRVIACSPESTGLGNMVWQLKALGYTGSVEEGQQIIAETSVLEEYNPADHERWNNWYKRTKEKLDETD